MTLSAYIAYLQTLRAHYGDADIQPLPLTIHGVSVTFGAVEDRGDCRSASPTLPPPQPKPDAPPSETQRRLTICRACPDYSAVTLPVLSVPVGTCRQCGCVLAIKARIASEACPLGRWSAPVLSPGDHNDPHPVSRIT